MMVGLKQCRSMEARENGEQVGRVSHLGCCSSYFVQRTLPAVYRRGWSKTGAARHIGYRDLRRASAFSCKPLGRPPTQYVVRGCPTNPWQPMIKFRRHA